MEFTRGSRLIVGLANNNPFNVKQVDQIWDGSVAPFIDAGGHAVFCDPLYSVRAAVRILARYAMKGADTLRKMIAYYAPLDDNNEPEKYAQYIADHLRRTIDTPLGIFDSKTGEIKDRSMLIYILRCMLECEIFAGYELPLTTITSGIKLYERDFVD